MSTCNVSTSSNYMQVIIGANNYILQKNMDQIYYVPYKLLINKIRMLANTKKFIIFEDRKFCDIGSTFVEQYTGGLYNIKDWSDIITVNCLSGEGIIKTFSKVNKGKKKGFRLDFNKHGLKVDLYNTKFFRRIIRKSLIKMGLFQKLKTKKKELLVKYKLKQKVNNIISDLTKDKLPLFTLDMPSPIS